MDDEGLPSLYPWSFYSRKLISRIENPFCAGLCDKQEAMKRNWFYTTGSSGDKESGNAVSFSLSVDKEGGEIRDARFQAYGDSILIGAAETLCELIVGKTYHEATHLSLHDIDLHLRDTKEKEAFSKAAYSHIALAFNALINALDTCTHIPLYASPPSFQPKTPLSLWPDWELLSKEEQLQAIEQVLKEEVLPIITRDAGGLQVLSLEDKTVTIAYSGSCASCISATGSTLYYIQNVLRSRIHPAIVVIPKL